MSAGRVRVTVAHHGLVRVLVVGGDLDLTTADEFAERSAQAAEGQAERFVLDLSGLRFIDCCGARALVAVTRAVPEDCPVIVRAIRPAVRRVFELLGLELERRPRVADPAWGNWLDRERGPGLDRTARQLHVAWARSQHVMAETRLLAGVMAATEDQVAVTLARMAERTPARRDRLRQLSEEARREATQLRDRAQVIGTLAAWRGDGDDRNPGAESGAGPLRARVTLTESGPVLVLTGQVDMRSSGTLIELLVSRVSSDTRRLVVEVSGLSFADSAAVRALMMAANVLEERGTELVVLRPQRTSATMMRLLGADELIAIAGQAADSAEWNRVPEGAAASGALEDRASPDAVAQAGHDTVMVSETRNCQQCGAVFMPRREHARFCSSSCRDSWNRQRGGDAVTEASALRWTVTAMRNVNEWLAAAGAQDRSQAFEAIGEAVWWVTMVDATLNRHHLQAYQTVMDAQPVAERQLVEGILAGLRFVRNQMGYHIGQADFIQPVPDRSGGDGGPITAWSWRSLPEPGLAWLPPRGRAWETTRYQAYQAQLAGHSIGEIFGQAAAFLKLASARATRHA